MDVTMIPPVTTTKTMRVAAYARVSTEHDRQQASIAHQISYYTRLIQAHPSWQYAGVFADDGVSGTTTTIRAGFNELIDLARNGGVDIILTKSISRFARNTLDLLTYVRELKSLGVSVRFEQEQIDTLSTDGELLLTLLASFAQAESQSNSQAVTWAIRKKFGQGIPHSRQPYGYRYSNGTLTVVAHEAIIVRRLFANYLNGITPEETARRLNAEGQRPRRGTKFRGKNLRLLLSNPVYTGSLMLQDQYRPHIANRTTLKNTGELDRYWIENNHEPIIDQATFDAVQKELARRRLYGRAVTPTGGSNALTSLIECSQCGRHYHRRTKTRAHKTYKYWWCWRATQGKGNPCQANQLPETKLQAACSQALGITQWDDTTVIENISRIIAHPGHIIDIHLTNGRTTTICLTNLRQG